MKCRMCGKEFNHVYSSENRYDGIDSPVSREIYEEDGEVWVDIPVVNWIGHGHITCPHCGEQLKAVKLYHVVQVVLQESDDETD